MTVTANHDDNQSDNKIEQPKVEQPVTPAATAPQVEESKEDKNWKRFREERERERKLLAEEKRKREEAEKQTAAMKSMVEAITNKPSYSDQPAEEGEDDRIKKLVAIELQKADQKRLEENRLREQSELPYKLAQTYSNFDQVCSDENLDYIQYHYPEIYSTFKAAPDSFEKWGNVYKAVKRLVPNPSSGKDEKRIEQNLKKPQSISLPGVASTSESMPYKIDEKRRADNWSRMQKIMKGVNK